ncbi:Crp/Fnr family transcriptional regulator [Methylobacterium sp. Leaf399]|uniref:Crp/Fnr family transcriptional regulator n=1 Tax=unclassified Methylobacterium TaxID=2615210 RepID=UPI0006F26F41|nr:MULTISPECIES: Crp/Fnr family transcriptional regulator [unclassified Methylobacterium]KQP50831.1 Crp/Fnr family transcriptional regulator [Methylobacterium sp. Leaf108]KQT07812.1 Crp/Fnr family transcriptional regulator [Methylobacterium sp. Leaf399]KQT88927.1 Crp/Fnr family transcriptional regulator [Methylobacterium sp. Leaf466]
MASDVEHPLLPLIRKLESLTTLSDEERAAIESLPVKVQALRAQWDIVRDGDASSHCCLILEGWLCRYKIISEGKRQIFSFHIAGDIPDLQSLHIPVMDHNLATLTAATVAFIPHAAMHDLTTRFPSIAAKFWRDTLVDAAIFREWLVCMGRRSAFDHLAHLFCELYFKQEAIGLADDYCCPLPITQVDLADATGLSNVHVNRVLMTMRGMGMITLRSNTLIIKAWDELLQAAEFDASYLHLRKRIAK